MNRVIENQRVRPFWHVGANADGHHLVSHASAACQIAWLETASPEATTRPPYKGGHSHIWHKIKKGGWFGPPEFLCRASVGVGVGL